MRGKKIEEKNRKKLLSLVCLCEKNERKEKDNIIKW